MHDEPAPDHEPAPLPSGDPHVPKSSLEAAPPLPVFPPPAAEPFAWPAPLPVIAAPPARASTTFLLLVCVVSVAADLTTKAWAKATLAGPGPRGQGAHRLSVIKDHVEFIFAQNPGGAWSFLRSLPDTLRRPFFLVVSAAAIVFIVSIYRRGRADQVAMRWGLALALGGAIGNLVDRIRYGWVIDFIDISARWGGRDHHWPTFNVADIAIVLGVGFMAIDLVRARGPHPAGEAHPAG